MVGYNRKKVCSNNNADAIVSPKLIDRLVREERHPWRNRFLNKTAFQQTAFYLFSFNSQLLLMYNPLTNKYLFVNGFPIIGSLL
jgi:hypothetical protein